MTTDFPTDDVAPSRTRTAVRWTRNVVALLAGTVGLAVATAGPAFAGLRLNHVEPLIRIRPPR